MKTLGTIAHERVRIHFPERRSVTAPAPTPTLFVGDRRMVLDADRFTWRQLRETLPTPLIHATLADLTPFILFADIKGLIR